ncbi:hypothetical protein [Segetibacter aerophilus]|uniref:Uncharacterized protein n=1 Tax=Segetibacter aerophilus TaxID=670293 RepID=A0A512BC52_9BACT|nr:hypothetical protein [Segetibacter aerophilus]GEO09494.1 hypothetical protein SAE01_19900 [Segetibacter aerophilus]
MENIHPTKINHDFVTEEFRQAWTHYRHLEEGRVKAMNFFYTVLFVVVGLSLTVIKDFDKRYLTWVLLGIFVLFFCLNIFSLYIYLNIKKTGFVLRHYEDVMRRVRIMMYDNSYTYDSLFNIRDRQHNVLKLKVFSAQYSAEYILILFMYLIDMIILGLVLKYYPSLGFLFLLSIISILAFLFITKTVLIYKGSKKVTQKSDFDVYRLK